jgi:hypothetical protein
MKAIQQRVIKHGIPLMTAGLVAAALSSAPVSTAAVPWVAGAVSLSAGRFDFSPGSTAAGAQQNVMDGCRSKYADCTYVISGQQCVAAVMMGGQVFGARGATNDIAERNASEQAISATGLTQGKVGSDCVTNF